MLLYDRIFSLLIIVIQFGRNVAFYCPGVYPALDNYSHMCYAVFRKTKGAIPIMSRILIPEKSDNCLHLRANLHCHSTISDGSKSPVQLRDDYKAHGYDVLCLTDHDIFIPHNDLSQEDFLMLNGLEMEINDPEADDGRCCHLCFIAKDRDNVIQPCYHRTEYMWGNAAKLRGLAQFDENKPDFVRDYSAETINRLIKTAQDEGFFVTYNHPTWSQERYPHYSRYKGMDAMEIVNFGCVVVGYDDDNGHAYDDILHCDNKCYCIATDDNHNRYDDENPNCDSYGGYTMIVAPSLEYNAVIKALSEGSFYSSTGDYKHVGPEILSLEITDDSKVKIRTSPARQINFMTNRMHCRCAVAEAGKTVNEAIFDLNDDIEYFRLTVVDEGGYKAYTNAYFTADM